MVLSPEPRRRVDLLDDIDPGTRWIIYREPALQQPFPVERIATGRPGRMIWGHEREAKRMVDASNTTWKPHHRI